MKKLFTLLVFLILTQYVSAGSIVGNPRPPTDTTSFVETNDSGRVIDLSGATSIDLPPTNLRSNNVTNVKTISHSGINVLTYTDTNIVWDLSEGNIALVELTNNPTINNPTNILTTYYTLIVIQDTTGGRTLSYGSFFDWGTSGEPTLTVTGDREDVLTFLGRATNKLDCSLGRLGFLEP